MNAFMFRSHHWGVSMSGVMTWWTRTRASQAHCQVQKSLLLRTAMPQCEPCLAARGTPVGSYHRLRLLIEPGSLPACILNAKMEGTGQSGHSSRAVLTAAKVAGTVADMDVPAVKTSGHGFKCKRGGAAFLPHYCRPWLLSSAANGHQR